MQRERNTKLGVIKTLSVAIAFALLAAACSSSTNPTEPTDTTESMNTPETTPDAKEITLVLGTLGDFFYTAMACGAQFQADLRGVNLNVQGPGQWDAALQIPIVDAVAASNPDAIIIAVNDDTALFSPLKDAVDAGATLILVDTNLADASIASGHIGSDFVVAGQQGAATIAELIGGEGKVLGIFAPPGVSTNDDGREGFTAEMEKNPGIELLPFEYSAGEPGKSAAIVTAVLAANPDLAAVFTFNGNDSQGIVSALREAGATEQVTFVSGDAQPFQVQQLRDGLVEALVIHSSYKMGILAVDSALKAIAGEELQAEVALPTVVGTLENLSDPEVADSLYEGCS